MLNFSKLALSLGSAAVVLMTSLSAQTFPFSENRWDNPEFVDRFLGSYGVLTDREPKITTDENTFFQEQLQPLLQADQLETAAETLRASLTPESTAVMYYTLANLYLSLGKNEKAIEQYEAAIKKFPNFLRAYKNLGLAYIQNQQFAEARDMFIKSMELGDASGATYGLIAYCYLNLNESSLSRDSYSIARVLEPNNREWVIGFAQALMQTDEYLKAISVFKDLIRKEPGKAAYYTQVSNAYIALNDFESAAQYLELQRRAVEASSANLLLLGDLYVNLGLPGLAYDAYRAALDSDESVKDARATKIVDSFLRRGSLELAKQYLERFLVLRGHEISRETRLSILTMQAQMAFAERDDARGVELLEEVIKLSPFNGQALLQIGDYYANRSEFEDAIYHYELAQKVESSAATAFVQHARVMVKMQEYLEALDLLEEAQRLDYQANVARYMDALQRIADAQN